MSEAHDGVSDPTGMDHSMVVAPSMIGLSVRNTSVGTYLCVVGS